MNLEQAKLIADATKRGMDNGDASTTALRNDGLYCLSALKWALKELESK